MRLKGKIAAGVVFGIVAVIVGLLVFHHTKHQQAANEEDFLRQMEERRQQEALTSEGTGLLAPASAARKDALEPSIAVDEKDLEFGTIPNTGPTTIEVPIRNTGQAKLEVKDIQSSCQCTVVDWKKNQALTIEPNSQVNIKVTMIPNLIAGFEATRKLTFTSNDPMKPLLEVPTHTKIEPEFESVPNIQDIDFGTAEKGTRPEMTFIIRQAGEELIHVEGINMTRKAPELDISFEKRPQDQWAAPNRPECAVRVALNTEAAPVGKYAGAFHLKTTCKRLPVLPCTIKAVVNAFFTVQPAAVDFGRVQLGAAGSGTVLVKAAQPIEIKDVSISAHDMTAEVKPGAAAGSAIIQVTVAESAAKGQREEQLSFTVASPDKATRHSMRVHGIVLDAVQARLPQPDSSAESSG